jgi:hypothetical protein
MSTSGNQSTRHEVVGSEEPRNKQNSQPPLPHSKPLHPGYSEGLIASEDINLADHAATSGVRTPMGNTSKYVISKQATTAN